MKTNNLKFTYPEVRKLTDWQMLLFFAKLTHSITYFCVVILRNVYRDSIRQYILLYFK